MREVSGVAASSLLAPALTGPLRRGVVVLSSPTAAYAQVGRDVIALLGPGATSLPCAVLLPRATPLDLPPAGARVSAGEGFIAWPEGRCSVSRWWLPARVRAGNLDADRVAAFAEALRVGAAGPAAAGGSRLDEGDRRRIGEFVVRVLRHDVPGAAEPARLLLGRGPGSTPAADDALAGALLTLRAAGAVDAQDQSALDRLLAPATALTTVLSAALLRHAVGGWAADAVVRAVAALQRSTVTTDIAAATHRLLRLGHTSGADTALGMMIAADAVLERTAPMLGEDEVA